MPSDSHTYLVISNRSACPSAQQKLRYHLMHIPSSLSLNETRFCICCLHDNFASEVNLCGENFRGNLFLRIVEKKPAKFEQNRNRKNFVPRGISYSSLILLLLLWLLFSMALLAKQSFGGLRLDHAGATGSSAGSPLGRFSFQNVVSSPGVIVL